MTATELAVGTLLGFDDSVRADLRRAATGAPRAPSEALIGTVARHLQRRNYVLFSGGLDSSLVLSAATEACRRAGLEPPIPITQCHRGHPDVDESTYQEAVVRHLSLDDWIVLDVDRELDILGAPAQRELRGHGLGSFVRFPSYEWVLSQIPEPGLVLSGEGGDVVLGPAPLARVHRVRHSLANRRWRRRAIVELARWPGDARGDRRLPLPWLTPLGRREALPRLRETLSGAQWTMRTAMERFRSRRSVVAHIREWEELAARFQSTYLAPLLDVGFLGELVRSVPDREFINRNILLRTHFGGMLPPEVEQRTTKCLFDAVIYGATERDFAQRWNGKGVPDELVDPDVLRESWVRGDNARNWLLLQHAWLATEGSS